MMKTIKWPWHINSHCLGFPSKRFFFQSFHSMQPILPPPHSNIPAHHSNACR